MIEEIIDAILISVCILETGCQATATWMMLKCKRIPLGIKCSNISFLLSDLAIALSIALSRILAVTGDTFLLHHIRTILVRTFFSVSWATTTHLAVDRLLLVLIPHRYKSLLTERMFKIWTALDWIIPISASVSSLILTEVFTSESPDSCYNEKHFLLCTEELRSILFGLYLLFGVAYLVSNSVTVFLLKMRSRVAPQVTRSGMPNSNPYIEYRRQLIKITFFYFVFQLFFVSHEIIVDFFPQYVGSVWRKLLQVTVFFGYIAISTAKLKFCMWKLEEFRYHFITTFLFWNTYYREKAEQMRSSVFGAQTFELRQGIN